MKINIVAGIARHYLFSKKRHGAVGVITGVSMCGVAIATAAIVIVLSVFNGFQNILIEKESLLGSDIDIHATEGKIIYNADSLIEIISSLKGVAIAYSTASDKALALYDGHEMPVSIHGVDEKSYAKATAITTLIHPDGTYLLSSANDDDNDYEELDEETRILLSDETSERKYYAVISTGVALRLGAHPDLYLSPSERAEHEFVLFAPRKEGRVNMANPSESFTMEMPGISGVFQTMQAEYDRDVVILDIEPARRLLGMQQGEATSIEVIAMPGVNVSALASEIRGKLSKSYKVRDSEQMQEVNFRMVKIEKWLTFLLLAFILIVASFNIISSMSMLVLDKQPDLGVLHALGWPKKWIGWIFGMESVMVTSIGGLIGIILGSLLSLMQQYWGFIKLNGDPTTLVVSAYPIQLKLIDLAIVAIPIILIGIITAIITSRFAESRIHSISTH